MPLRSKLWTRRDTPLRFPLAAAALTIAAAHIPVTGEDLQEALYIGLLFILLEVAAVLLATLLLVRPTEAASWTAASLGGLGVLALVLNRTVGLPQITDDIGNWSEPLALVSLVGAAFLALGGVLAALHHPVTASVARMGAAIGVALLLLGAVATTTATIVANAREDMHGMVMEPGDG